MPPSYRETKSSFGINCLGSRSFPVHFIWEAKMSESCRAFFAMAALAVTMGCANVKKQDVRKEMMAMQPIVLPNEMCAEHGTVAVSNDKEGDRMICELQNQLGSHIPRCVCVDEGFSDRERELAFETLHQAGMINPCGGAPMCGGAVPGSGPGALGTPK
jgi:hypothetical protein